MSNCWLLSLNCVKFWCDDKKTHICKVNVRIHVSGFTQSSGHKFENQLTCLASSRVCKRHVCVKPKLTIVIQYKKIQ